MADGKVPTSGELFDLIVKGSANRQALEQAIQKGLQSFTETANTEIDKLVKANTIGPDVSAEMQELNKAIIKQTVAIIKKEPGSKSD